VYRAEESSVMSECFFQEFKTKSARDTLDRDPNGRFPSCQMTQVLHVREQRMTHFRRKKSWREQSSIKTEKEKRIFGVVFKNLQQFVHIHQTGCKFCGESFTLVCFEGVNQSCER
jgi:hypothetical protein